LIIVEKSKENHYVCQEKSFYQPFFTGLPPARFTGGHWIRFTSDNQVFLMARKTGNTDQGTAAAKTLVEAATAVTASTDEFSNVP
jgi:hypothetical protein